MRDPSRNTSGSARRSAAGHPFLRRNGVCGLAVHPGRSSLPRQPPGQIPPRAAGGAEPGPASRRRRQRACASLEANRAHLPWGKQEDPGLVNSRFPTSQRESSVDRYTPASGSSGKIASCPDRGAQVGRHVVLPPETALTSELERITRPGFDPVARRAWRRDVTGSGGAAHADSRGRRWLLAHRWPTQTVQPP